MKLLCRSLYLLVILISAGCIDGKKEGDIYEIDIEGNVASIEPLNLSDYVDRVSYVLLKNDSVIIEGIRQIDFYQDFILVSDRKNCVLYDSKGNYLCRIGREGKGNGEYITVSNVKIGKEKIYLQDYKDILIYDLKGKFLKKLHPEVNAGVRVMKSWCIYQDSLIFCQIPNYSGKEEFKACIFNECGKIIKSFKNYIFLNRTSENINSYDEDADFYQFNGNNCFKERMNDTLFILNKKVDLEPICYFNLGSFSQPLSQRELGIFQMIKKIDNYIYIDNIYESASYLFIDCDFGNHSPAKKPIPTEKYGAISNYYTTKILGIYNKNLKELFFSLPALSDDELANNGLYNDFDGGSNFYPTKMINDSTFAMCIDAYLLKAHVTSEAFKNSIPKHPEKKKELEKLATNLNENDNPVLMLVKIKKE